MVERQDPAPATDERTTLVEFLDFQRDTLAWKTDGLDHAQAATRSVPPSTMSLTGLVRHMAEVERFWFQRIFEGRDVPYLYWQSEPPDLDFGFEGVPDLSADLAVWRAEVAESRSITSRASTLDQLAAVRRHGERVNLRWILVHMATEYARHLGHADLLREAIDGETGD